MSMEALEMIAKHAKNLLFGRPPKSGEDLCNLAGHQHESKSPRKQRRTLIDSPSLPGIYRQYKLLADYVLENLC